MIVAQVAILRVSLLGGTSGIGSLRDACSVAEELDSLTKISNRRLAPFSLIELTENILYLGLEFWNFESCGYIRLFSVVRPLLDLFFHLNRLLLRGLFGLRCPHRKENVLLLRDDVAA